MLKRYEKVCVLQPSHQVFMRVCSCTKQLGHPSPTFNAYQHLLNSMMLLVSHKLGRKYRTNRVLNSGPVFFESTTLSAHPLLLPLVLRYIEH